MTPERMPAVIDVPVLPLLLTVTVRADVPRLIGLTSSVSPKAVPEPSTRFVNPNGAVPQVSWAEAPPRLTTRRSGVPAAKPLLPATNCT